MRDYGVEGQLGLEPTFYEYIDKLCNIFDEVKRVLKKEGTCWVNIGDTYYGSGKGAGGDIENSKQVWTFTNKEKKICQYCGKEFDGYKYQQFCGAACSGVDNTPRKDKGKMEDKSLCQIPSRFAIEMSNRGWILRNEIIWWKRNCLNGGVSLYAKTQKGIIVSTLKDLVRLKPETVELWDGYKWNKVKEWLKNDDPKNIKKIIFRNGNKITCTGEHLFPVGNDLIKADTLKVGDIINNCLLPDNNYSIIHLPDSIGRFIGLYLAEGSLGNNNNCLQFSSHTKEINRFSYLQGVANSYGSNCNKYDKIGKSCTMNIYSPILISIIKEYISGNNAHNKHLTNNVWKRNNDFLQQIIIGYLEGDGHIDNNRHRLCFCRNKLLAGDLRTMCARLGYRIKLQEGYVKLNNKLFPKYSGEIRLNNNKTYNQKSDYQIIDIKNGKKSGNFWDVVLENPPHLFSDSSGMLIHNCMPSSVEDRFTVDFEKIFFFVKSKKYYFEQQFDKYISNPHIEQTGHTGNKDVDVKIADFYTKEGKNKRCVWDIITKPFKEAHFATFPEELIETPIKAGCPENGIVLDCFMGAGTTAVVVKKLNRNYIGCELNEKYIKISENRIFNEIGLF